MSDGTNHDKIFGDAFPPLDVEHAIFVQERSRTNEKAHRQESLESLAVRLQLGHQRTAIQKLLDDYRAELPPIAEQDEELKLWRLLLHRIDLRNFEVAQTLPDGSRLIQSTAPASDVQAVVERRRPHMERTSQRLSMWLWATQCWEKKADGSSDPNDWPARLAEARKMESEEDTSRLEERLECSAVPEVAAICIRDHWDKLTPEQRNWCVACVCRSAAEGGGDHDPVGHMMRGTLDRSRAAAEILPILLGRPLPEAQRNAVLTSLSVALTHPDRRVRTATAQAVGRRLWDIDPGLAWCSVGALVREAGLLKEARKRESGTPFNECAPWAQNEQAAAASVRPMIVAGQPVDRAQLLTLRLGDGSAHNLLPSILAITVLAPPVDPLAVEFFSYVSATLAGDWAWEAENGQRSNNSKFDDDQDGLDSEKERMLSGHLAQFLLDLTPDEALKVAAPVLDSVLVHPENGAGFLDRLIRSQDQRTPTPTFWALWQAILDRLLVAIRQHHPVINSRHLGKLLEMIFLGVRWKPDSRDWLPLTGEAHRVEAAFNFFAPNAAIIEFYLGFLRRIGSTRLLPTTLVLVASRVITKPAAELLTSESVRGLEEILGRFIYSDPSKLKASPKLQAAVLLLLNACIERGSSVCYRQRDDFLTPSIPARLAG